MKLLIFVLSISLSLSLAITPPKNGKFPTKMLKFLKENPDFIKYGDPGWMKKIAHSKELHETKLAKGATQLEFNLPVLLGSFSDETGFIDPADFQNLFFGSDSSFSDYYDKVSFGNFSVSGQVYGWFTADQTFEYYTGDNNGNTGPYPQNVKGFVYSIAKNSDATVDFSQFDNDGPDKIPDSGDDDGYVDAICVVYAGAGAEYTVNNGSFWAHQSSLSTPYITNDVGKNGEKIKISTYFIGSEEAGGGDGNGNIRELGVFTHEFGHVLGLPDLYDRTDSETGPDFDDSEGIGNWCLMAGGAWGGDGNHPETPTLMSAWCKYKLGWLQPTVIKQPVNGYSLNQAETNAQALLLWVDPYALSHYFLVENRQQTGFDKFLPGSGILIFDVDESRDGFDNDDETYKLVDLEEADVKIDNISGLDNNLNRGDDGDPYPGLSNNTSFTDLTTPSAQDYNLANTGISISNISSSSSTMTMDITPKQEMVGYSIAYDELGFRGDGLGNNAVSDVWGAVKFQATYPGVLKAVDVVFFNEGIEYFVYIYNSMSFDGSYYTPAGYRAAVKGTSANSGWNTINFPSGFNVNQNQNFVVVVWFQDESYIAYDPTGDISGNSFISFGNNDYQSLNGAGDMNLRVRIESEAATDVDETKGEQPYEFSLSQNYPNPFNPTTTINYSLPNSTDVQITIFNTKGQVITTLVNEHQNAGSYSIVFDGQELASGIYLYKIRAGEQVQVRKMLLVK